MSAKLLPTAKPIIKSNNRTAAKVEQIGSCVYCKTGIFSDQEHVRAKPPMIGKAHEWCVAKAEILAEQFPAVVLLERERPGLGTQPPSAYVGRHRADELAAAS